MPLGMKETQSCRLQSIPPSTPHRPRAGRAEAARTDTVTGSKSNQNRARAEIGAGPAIIFTVG